MIIMSLSIFYSGFDWDSVLNGASSFFSLLSFFVYIIAPVILTIFFVKNFKRFRYKSFILKYGEITENLNFRNKFSATFISLFCYRRLILAIIFTFLSDYPFAQTIVVTLSSVFVIITLGQILPFREPLARRMEYFNEITILFCFDHLYLFTDFVFDPVTRFNTGYSLIGFALFNFVFNIIVSLSVAIR